MADAQFIERVDIQACVNSGRLISTPDVLKQPRAAQSPPTYFHPPDAREDGSEE
jgi:hypothetical protein